MPLAERTILKLLCAKGDGSPVDLLILTWTLPTGTEVSMMALPLRICGSGLILAIPEDGIPESQLEAALETPEEDAVLGPSCKVGVSVQEGEDPDEVLNVVMVEFSMAVREKLAKKPVRLKKPVKGFGETVATLPSFAELEEHVEAWIERGEVRNEVFLTAGEISPAKKPQTGMDGLMAQIMGLREELGQRFEILEDKVQDLQQHPQLRKPAPPVLKAKPKPGASPDLDYGKGEEEVPKKSVRGDPAELIARMKELAPGGPRRTPDQTISVLPPHREHLAGGLHQPAEGGGMAFEEETGFQGRSSKQSQEGRRQECQQRSRLRPHRFLRFRIQNSRSESGRTDKKGDIRNDPPSELKPWLEWLYGFLCRSSLPLGKYVKSTTLSPRSSTPSFREGELFPCPPPFPWVVPQQGPLRRSRRRDCRWQHRRCRELWVNFMVSALSQQALQCSVAPERGRRGQPLTAAQEEMCGFLESLASSVSRLNLQRLDVVHVCPLPLHVWSTCESN